MSKFLVALALVVGVAVAANDLQSFAARQVHAIKSVATLAKSNEAHARTLQSLQSVTIPNIPICQTADFVALFGQLIVACSSEPSVFGSRLRGFTSEAEAMAGFDDFCTKQQCMPLLMTRVFGTSYDVCLPVGEIGDSLKTLKTQCTKSTETGTFCGVTGWWAGQMDCDSYRTQATCNAAPHMCMWMTQTTDGYTRTKCEASLTQTGLAKVCNDCLQRFMRDAAVGGADTLAMVNLVMCPKIGNSFCAPLVMSQMQLVGKGSGSNSDFDGMCADATNAGCLRKILNGVKVTSLAQANQEFARCRASYPSSVNSYCYPSYSSSVSEAYNTDQMLDLLCRQNGAGSYCIPAYMAAINKTQYSCNAGCNDVCRRSIGAGIDTMGCCAGAVDEAMMPRILTQADVPSDFTIPSPTAGTPIAAQVLPTAAPGVTAGAAAAGTGANDVTEPRVNARPGMLQSLIAMTCPVPNLNERFATRCKVVRVKETAKTLKVALKWSAVSANPTTKARIEDSMANDLATRMGIARSDIPYTNLKEDASVKVELAASTGLKTLAAVSGCALDFRIATTSAAQQTAATAAFDNAITTNTMPLPSTIQTVKAECTSCAGAGGVGALNNAAAINAPPSSASVASYLAAVALAFAIALCM